MYLDRMMQKQKGFVVEGDSATLQDIPMPQPLPHECVVKVLIAGVCNTDLEIMKGYMGFKGVVGHEFVGLVETAPPGKEHLIGKRVVGDINLICPDQATACFTCQCGGARMRNHCTTRTVLGILNKDGTYQERLTLPAANLHVVPDNVSTENAAFAEPLAAAFRIPEQQLISHGDKIAIVGDVREADSNPRPFALLEPGSLCPPSLQSAEGRTFESHSGRASSVSS